MLLEDPDNRYVMIDSTIVRAHQQEVAGKGGQGPGSGPFQGWAEHQDSHGVLRKGKAAAIRSHRRTGGTRYP